MPEHVTPPPSAELQSALDWLSRPTGDGPHAELVALCAHLAGATAARLPASQWHTILEIFHGRVTDVTATLKPQLLEAALPLSRRLRMIAQGLVEAHGALASGYLRVLRESGSEPLDQLRQDQAVRCARAAHHLAEQQEIAYLVSAPEPENIWRQALDVFRYLKESLPGAAPRDAMAADRALKRMLALAAGQPETCAARELAFIVDYLRSFSGTVDIRFAPPAHLDDWYWLAEDGNAAPTAATRRAPPAGGQPTFFSCQLLAEGARAHLTRLEAGELPEAIGLSALAASPAFRDALARMANRWLAPPKRQLHRRHTSYRVQVCADLEALWLLLANRADRLASREGLPITDWMVLNESAGGFAMMHLAGDVEGIIAGAAVGIRDANDPWRLCLVRWARSENAEHVELGLELVAPSARAVQILFPTGEGKPVPALLMPSLPRLGRNESLMTARGRYAAGPFTLISEMDGKLQLTECAARDLAMQTASVDVFEFDRDFNPA